MLPGHRKQAARAGLRHPSKDPKRRSGRDPPRLPAQIHAVRGGVRKPSDHFRADVEAIRADYQGIRAEYHH